MYYNTYCLKRATGPSPKWRSQATALHILVAWLWSFCQDFSLGLQFHAASAPIGVLHKRTSTKKHRNQFTWLSTAWFDRAPSFICRLSKLIQPRAHHDACWSGHPPLRRKIGKICRQDLRSKYETPSSWRVLSERKRAFHAISSYGRDHVSLGF